VGKVVFSGNDVRGSFDCTGNAQGVDDRGGANAITGATTGCLVR
jgi:hypothetical protein